MGVGLDAAFLTLRAVNPVANVVIGTAIGATLVIPAVFAKSKDHKWKKKMKKADKMIAAMEFAQGKQISDPSLDSYQGYNKESVDAIAESTNSSVNDVVWALQCFRLSTYDGKPFNVSGEDWNFMVEALQQTEWCFFNIIFGNSVAMNDFHPRENCRARFLSSIECNLI